MTDCVVQGAVSTGIVRMAGLTKGGRVQKVSVNAITWTALPLLPLADRNAIAIQNRSGVVVRLNYDYAAPLPVNDDGMELAAFGERQYDVTDQIVIYAKVISGGATVDVWIEEIA